MTTAVRAPVDSVTAYAASVLAGGVMTGELVKLAAARHMRDMEHGAERGYHFSEEAAEKAFRMFEMLRLADGPGAGERFQLLPWQRFVIGSLFGWLGPGNKRRYRYALVEVARANGKTPLAAGVGLYGLMADREVGAQVYSAATTRDQAKIAFNDGWHMAEKSPSLWSRLLHTQNNLAFLENGSFFRPLAAEASTMDGLRVHIALVDELHEHPNGDVLAKLRTGMKSSQPLMFMITTAGFDRNSVCWEEHQRAVQILNGDIENDTYFAYVATLDDGDDWRDESVWPKSNPSLGTTVSLQTLRDECALAIESPRQENEWKRYRGNIWTESDTRWLSSGVWEANMAPVDPETLRGRDCYAGLDLSSTADLTALELYFPDKQGGGDWMHFYFVPEENMQKRTERDHVPYRLWADQGYLTATPGNFIDHEVVRETLNRLLDDGYNIREVAFDPFNASQLVVNLQQDGFVCVPVRQGFAALSPPTKELETLLLAHKMRVGDHPVTRWAASNVVLEQDSSANVKPSRLKSTEKIDPIVAMVMALDRAIRHEDDQLPIPQVYLG